MVSLSEIEGNASNLADVTDLANKKYFKESVDETSNRETMIILEELDKIINKPGEFSKILYTIKEVEKEIIRKWKVHETKPDYIILTDEYLDNPRNKNRLYRILQIAKNNKIRSKVVDVESEAGKIIMSFGGLICFTK